MPIPITTDWPHGLREISAAWVALHPADRHMLVADRVEADRSFGESLRWLIRMGATPAETESWMQAEALVIDVMLAGLPDRELVHGNGWPICLVSN